LTDPSRAVFLSYASQDAEAAQRLCEALRAARIEVWFDRSELRGGDLWDQKIRREIRDCALFVAVISQHTQQRLEGYFRREWKLAVECTHDMAEQKPFLMPVVVDGTGDKEAIVPDLFRAVQWTRVPGGMTSAAFVERVQRLLAPEESAAPAPTPAHGAVAGSKALGPRHRRWLYGAAVPALLLALGYLGLAPLNRSRSGSPQATSIAVLPLVNESGEVSQQYFSDGISEDLITALSRFPGLKVIGRTSAFQFKDTKEDSRSIGVKLGVAHLLVGSVRRSGDMVRVSTELIDTADGSTQWSEHYDRPYGDLFALQDEITRAVTATLRAKLLPGEAASAQSERPPGGGLEAYNAMLQGRFYSFKNTEADMRAAINYYTQATQLDPRYALAWSRLSLAQIGLGEQFLSAPQARVAYAKAREEAERALALAPDLAMAHNARGSVLQIVDLDWRGAEAEYRRAVALAPNDGEMIFALGNLLATYGKIEQAIDLTRRGARDRAVALELVQLPRLVFLGARSLR
jgi:TolB-like protein